MIVLKGKAKVKAEELKVKGKELQVKGEDQVMKADQSLLKSKFGGLWKKLTDYESPNEEESKEEEQVPDLSKAASTTSGEFDEL